MWNNFVSLLGAGAVLKILEIFSETTTTSLLCTILTCLTSFLTSTPQRVSSMCMLWLAGARMISDFGFLKLGHSETSGKMV